MADTDLSTAETGQGNVANNLSATTHPNVQKKVKKRRPKMFPTTVRQRLTKLGHHLQSHDTTEANMKHLIDRLSADLESYQIEAQRWQNRYLELKSTMDATSSSTADQEIQKTNAEETPAPETVLAAPVIESTFYSPVNNDEIALFLPQDHHTTSLDVVSPTFPEYLTLLPSNNCGPTFEMEFIGRLYSTANPSLSLVNMPPPNLQSTAGTLAEPWTFEAVLNAVDSMGHLFGAAASPATRPWANILLVKPDFSETKAKAVWNDIFAPINVHPSRLIFDSAPSSRRSSDYEVDDPDMDHMDRKLARASDLEVIDMLHYCSLLFGGFHQVVFQHERLIPLRDHLGKTCERLLREAIFSRNISSHSHLTQCLLDGIMGSLGHFSTHNMYAAIISVLELSWQINIQHPNMVHPVTQGLLSFLSVIMATSPGKRNLWMNRAQAIAHSARGSYFQLTTTGLLTECYFALMTRDENSLFQATSKLEELLAPSDQDDPRSNNEGQFTIYHPVPEEPVLNDDGHPITSDNLQKKEPYERGFFSFADSSSDTPTGDLHNQPHQSAAPNPPESQQSQPGTSQVEPDLDLLDFEYDSGCSSTSSTLMDKFYPCENLKTMLRVSLHLIRAEASLAFADESTCQYWVDEAERELKSLPFKFTSQKIFVMKNIFQATCNFPTGTRTVAQEFERRMVAFDRELCGMTT